MATIAFVVLPVAGHFNPTFKLARSLRRRGHNVYYLGLSSSGEHLHCRPEEYVSSQGMEYLTILDGVLPDTKGLLNTKAFFIESHHAISANKANIQKVIGAIQPDLFIVDKILLEMAFTTHELGYPTALLNTMLPVEALMGLLRSIRGEAAVEPLQRMPELILCPQELDFPNARSAATRYYIEASVDLQRQEPPFDWSKISGSKPLIYCSLGTHNYIYKDSKEFFRIVIDAMEAKKGWQMLMAAGPDIRLEELGPIPPNVTIAGRIPQIQVLKRAVMMITHGGLGSVKECIYFGVPMIVLPRVNDQPLNAARVAFHGLGLVAEPHNVSAERIGLLIDQLEASHEIKRRVISMKQRFREIEDSGRGVEVIETILAGSRAARIA